MGEVLVGDAGVGDVGYAGLEADIKCAWEDLLERGSALADFGWFHLPKWNWVVPKVHF